MAGREVETVSEQQEPRRPAAPPPERPSAWRILASALAAMTTTALLSTLGVAGTIIGAALASVVTVLANFVYSASIYHTAEKVTAVVPAIRRECAASDDDAAPADHPDEAPGPSGPDPDRPSWVTRLRHRLAEVVRRVGWRRLLALSLAAFALVIGAVTVIELAAGKPLSDVTRGRDGSGTTLFGGTARTVEPTPMPTQAPDRLHDLPGTTGPAHVPAPADPASPDVPGARRDPTPAPTPTAPAAPDPSPAPTAPVEEPSPGGTQEPAPDVPAPEPPPPEDGAGADAGTGPSTSDTSAGQPQHSRQVQSGEQVDPPTG